MSIQPAAGSRGAHFIPTTRMRTTKGTSGTQIFNAPLYRRDLDLVVVAQAESSLPSAQSGLTTSPVLRSLSRWAHPPSISIAGWGKAVMCEGLRRAKRLGALSATIGSYSTAAHALYTIVGFVEYTLSEPG